VRVRALPAGKNRRSATSSKERGYIKKGLPEIYKAPFRALRLIGRPATPAGYAGAAHDAALCGRRALLALLGKLVGAVALFPDTQVTGGAPDFC
jgi:hypothetical protein